MITSQNSLDPQTSPNRKAIKDNAVPARAEIKKKEKARASEKIAAKLRLLKELDATGRTTSWQAARLAHELHHVDRVPQKVISDALGKVKGTVSSYVKAATAEIEARESGFGAIDHLMGTDSAARMLREWKNLGSLDAAEVGFAEFIRVRLEAKSERDARKTITRDLIERRSAHLVRQLGPTLTRLSLSERCVPGDCAKWLERARPGSVRLLHADPPYGDYIKEKDGRLFADHSELAGLRTDCSNSSATAALRTTCDMLARSERVLAPDIGDGRGGGVLLLWQAAGSIVRREVVDAIDAAGLAIRWELFVHTGAAKLGDAKTPHSRNAEKLLVIQRRGDGLMRCDGGQVLAHAGCVILFEDILRQVSRWEKARGRPLNSFAKGKPMVPTVPKEFRHRKIRENSEVRNGDGHFMMKHEEVSIFLLSKYTMPGDRVVDLYGCSGSFCIAAEQFGANWTYIERHKKNFAFGVDRIRAMLDSHPTE